MMYHEIISLLQTIAIKDIIEIVLFSSIGYAVLRFLARDRDLFIKALGCFGLLLITYFFDLQGLYHFLLFFLPIIGVLFVLFHKETLQKNYVYLKRIQSPKNHEIFNPEQLVRILLNTMNAGNDFACIVELQDEIPLMSDHILNATLSETIVDMLVSSSLFDKQRLVLLRDGQVASFNCAYNVSQEDCFIDKNIKQLSPWKEHGLLITQKSDAIVIAIDARSRYFTLIAQGRIQDHLNAQAALRIIEHCCNAQGSFKEESYEHTYSPSQQKEMHY